MVDVSYFCKQNNKKLLLFMLKCFNISLYKRKIILQLFWYPVSKVKQIFFFEKLMFENFSIPLNKNIMMPCPIDSSLVIHYL